MGNISKNNSENNSERSIIITLPSSIEWSDYQKELDAVKDSKAVMNFKVPFLPKAEMRDRITKCWLVWRGHIVGWQRVCGFVEDSSFDCTTTGEHWQGNFIQRTGPFHALEKPIEMKGFQGWRYYFY